MLDCNVNYAGRIIDYAVVMETMGDRIKMLREAKGLTQTQLGEKVGVTKSAVSQWELGQTKDIKLQTFLPYSTYWALSSNIWSLGPLARPVADPAPAPHAVNQPKRPKVHP